MAKSTPTKAKAKAKARPAATSPAKPKVTVRTLSARRARFDYKTFLTRRFTQDIRIGELLAEFLGTFVLAAAVLHTSGNVIIAAIAIVTLVLALSKLSGGHVNPAVTVALWASRQMSGLRASAYVVAQLLGATLAYVVVAQFVNTMPVDPQIGAAVDPQTGAAYHVFEATALKGDWRPFLAEMLGALVFGLGIAAATSGKRGSFEGAWMIGGSLLVGLLLASQASSAILNPAVAMALSAYKFENWWTVWVYALAPVFGAAVGIWLYKIMQWEINSRGGNSTVADEE